MAHRQAVAASLKATSVQDSTKSASRDRHGYITRTGRSHYFSDHRDDLHKRHAASHGNRDQRIEHFGNLDRDRRHHFVHRTLHRQQRKWPVHGNRTTSVRIRPRTRPRRSLLLSRPRRHPSSNPSRCANARYAPLPYAGEDRRVDHAQVNLRLLRRRDRSIHQRQRLSGPSEYRGKVIRAMAISPH